MCHVCSFYLRRSSQREVPRVLPVDLLTSPSSPSKRGGLGLGLGLGLEGLVNESMLPACLRARI